MLCTCVHLAGIRGPLHVLEHVLENVRTVPLEGAHALLRLTNTTGLIAFITRLAPLFQGEIEHEAH